nr:MAG TPA: hypothetical protein [Caudoviricetes sp.]
MRPRATQVDHVGSHKISHILFYSYLKKIQ